MLHFTNVFASILVPVCTYCSSIDPALPLSSLPRGGPPLGTFDCTNTAPPAGDRIPRNPPPSLPAPELIALGAFTLVKDATDSRLLESLCSSSAPEPECFGPVWLGWPTPAPTLLALPFANFPPPRRAFSFLPILYGLLSADDNAECKLGARAAPAGGAHTSYQLRGYDSLYYYYYYYYYKRRRNTIKLIIVTVRV